MAVPGQGVESTCPPNDVLRQPAEGVRAEVFVSGPASREVQPIGMARDQRLVSCLTDALIARRFLPPPDGHRALMSPAPTTISTGCVALIGVTAG